MKEISYNLASEAKAASAVALSSGVETDVLTVTDTKHMQKSQLSVFFQPALTTATSIKFRLYHSPDGGANWYQVPSVNGSTGHLDDFPDIWDATSPAKFVRDFAMSASYALKVTGTAVAGNASVTVARAFVRDN